MITVEVNNKKIVLYSSIKELPLARYKAMQNYLLQDSGIGNTMADIDRHLHNAILFLGSTKTAECKEELTNLRYSFFSMVNGIDYKTKSFACLVKRIDDVVCDDITSDGLTSTVDALVASELAAADVETVWTDVKKNWMQN